MKRIVIMDDMTKAGGDLEAAGHVLSRSNEFNLLKNICVDGNFDNMCTCDNLVGSQMQKSVPALGGLVVSKIKAVKSL